MIVRYAAGMLAAAGLALSATSANATLVFVGSWEVDDGPAWLDGEEHGPLAYTAQEAAALLYGGTAADYVVSTAGDKASEIDGQAWYSVLGIGVGIFAQDYSAKHLGLYYGPSSAHGGGVFGPVSAYVNDWAVGSRYTNYAFRESDVTSGAPEPGTWALLILGFGLAGAGLRQRRAAAV